MIDTHVSVTHDEPSHIHIPRPSRLVRTHEATARRPIVTIAQQPVPAYRALSTSFFTANEPEPAECSAA